MTSSLVNKGRTPTRARGERVYKPGGKKEWRVVFWTHESTKPSRRQCSFSEAKYGKEAASLLSRAVLDYIDVKGVVPDDLHDPPILDPAKKELIEYYSALHESRKASQKKTRPKSHAGKGSSEPSIVPLYTLARTKSPSINGNSPVSPQTAGSIVKPDQLLERGNPRGDQFSSFHSNSPNEVHIPSPLSVIASTGPSNSDGLLTKSESGPDNSIGDCIERTSRLNNVQIPPIPNIASPNFSGIELNNMSSFDLDGLNSMSNKVISDIHKQGSLHASVPHISPLSISVFPTQLLPGIQSHPLQQVSSTQSSVFPDPSFTGCGFVSPDLHNILSHTSQRIALQNQFNFLSHLGYLQQLAGFAIAGVGGNSLAPAFASSSFLQNSPFLYGSDMQGLNASSQISKFGNVVGIESGAGFDGIIGPDDVKGGNTSSVPVIGSTQASTIVLSQTE
ncbi:ci-meta2, probable [Cryptosporidium felis]|nr:ci-meta2, probable [Cryptosporidium felis]